MAYLIVNDQNVLYKIAKNDTEKNSLNCTFPPYTTIDISDADFLKVKQNIVDVNISSGSATFTDIDNYSDTAIAEEDVKDHHKNLIEYIRQFLKNNPSNPFYTPCQNYCNYLETLDYSSITFPLNKTWEQYCEDNSIAYFHPLQIP
tara:strand:- start:43 stop:480 length:438 start_codon:yes stop_codon:yes gene_type:complete